MARGDPRSARTSPRSRGGGLFNGLLIGLVIGLLLAAGLAWYLNSKPSYKSPPDGSPPSKSAGKPAPAAVTPQTAPGTQPPTSNQAQTDYTFYDILPGEKPAKPVDAASVNGEIWWLQVAALKNPAEADRLKARLSLLGLQVATQKVQAAGLVLYRVRVGPYKHQDDAVADIDTLVENKIEHRLLKEPPNP
jgi:cell division protein FtsN